MGRLPAVFFKNTSEDSPHGILGGEEMSNVVYRQEWAEAIFHEFEDAYSDFTEDVAAFLHLTKDDIIYFLMADQEKWRLYKKLVKVYAHGAGGDNHIRSFRPKFHKNY